MFKSEKNLEKLREDVDAINVAIVDLLKKRFKLVEEIGEIKKREGIDVFIPSREKEIIEKVIRIRGDIPQESIEKIFRVIIEESKKCEM